MSIETLEDTIEATDQGLENQEDTVSTCTGCSTSIPQAPDITINNTTLDLGVAEANITIETFDAHTGSVTVSETPLAGYTPQVWRGGILQPNEGTDWSCSGKVFTFLPAPGLVVEDVAIRYAYEVV